MVTSDTPRNFGAYFGEPWASGICDEGNRVSTPVGEACALCGEPIGGGDQGNFVGVWDRPGYLAPTHRECSLREVLGGIGHLTDHVYWCGQQHDPDGGMSRRQSSLMVWDWVQINGFPVD